MSMDMMRMLIERLAKKGFYEIIFVLLSVHRNERYMDNLYKYVLYEMLATGWNEKVSGKEEFIKGIMKLLA